MDFTLERLSGGTRLAVSHLPQVESVAVGLWFATGGRHETVRLNGVSHFIEHLLFKGTRKRTARQISEAIEGVGGYLNAFTAEEATCYFAQTSRKHLETTIDVLVDMACNARFPAEEVERERGVIIEEIRMYEDQPAQVAQERVNALLWPDHALGRPLAGPVEGIARMKRRELMDYRRRMYHSGNLSVTVAGRVTPAEVKALLLPRLRHLGSGRAPGSEKVRIRQRRPRVVAVVKPVEQTHFALSFHSFSQADPRRYAARILNVIAGENMSSRLFQVIREQHGLAYSIQSSLGAFADTGCLSVSAGIENGNIEKALQLTVKTLAGLTRKAPSRAELQRAKEYCIGQMYLGLESTQNHLMWMGEGLMAYGKVIPPQDVAARLEAVTGAEVVAAGREIFSADHLNLAVVGPHVKQSALEAMEWPV